MGQLLTHPDAPTPAAPSAARIRRQPRDRATFWLMVPALALLVPIFVLPTVLLLTNSVTEAPGGLHHYREAFSSDLVRQVLVRSVGISATVTVISLVVGLPYAVAAVRSGPRLRALLLGAVASTLFFSVIVRAYAWLALLEQDGVIPTFLHSIGLAGADLTLADNRAGTIIGMVQY
ncbi:MAG: ABC transporter permease, partial [Nocardioidaceae bacterium]